MQRNNKTSFPLAAIPGTPLRCRAWCSNAQPHLELGSTPVHQVPGAQAMVLRQLDGHLLHLAVPADLQLHLCGRISAANRHLGEVNRQGSANTLTFSSPSQASWQMAWPLMLKQSLQSHCADPSSVSCNETEQTTSCATPDISCYGIAYALLSRAA